jgi:hypothetical protein
MSMKRSKEVSRGRAREVDGGFWDKKEPERVYTWDTDVAAQPDEAFVAYAPPPVHVPEVHIPDPEPTPVMQAPPDMDDAPPTPVEPPTPTDDVQRATIDPPTDPDPNAGGTA